jgi:hypothetical protein
MSREGGKGGTSTFLCPLSETMAERGREMLISSWKMHSGHDELGYRNQEN